MYILASLFAFMGLILVHELGHYIVARMMGFSVDSVNIGLGSPIWECSTRTEMRGPWQVRTFNVTLHVPFTQWYWGQDLVVPFDTEGTPYETVWWARVISWLAPVVHFLAGEDTFWAIRPIPVGGYVEIPDLQNEHVSMERLGAKILVFLAGPVTSVAVGVWLIAFAASAIGLPNSHVPAPEFAPYVTMSNVRASVWAYPSTWHDVDIQLMDEVLGTTEVTVADAASINALLQNGPLDEDMTLVMQRGEEIIALDATREVWQRVDIVDVGTVRARSLYAIPAAAFVIVKIAKAMIELLPETEERMLSGPIGITMVTARAAEEGSAFMFLVITAIISISIGLTNLLPIPPLDGGQILLFTIRSVTRKHYRRLELVALTLGALALVCVMVYTTAFDIIDLFK